MLDTINTMTVGQLSLESLEDLSKPQLAALHIELTGNLLDLSSDTNPADILRPLVAERLQPKVRRVASRKTPTGRPRKQIFAEPKSRINAYRPNTDRARLIALLGEGATLEEIMDKFGWTYQYAYSQVLFVHRFIGFGLEEDVYGVITVTT